VSNFLSNYIQIELSLSVIDMNKLTNKYLLDYLKSQARNKIVFHSQQDPGLQSIDIGLKLSERIYNFKESDKIAMRVSDALNYILNESIVHHEGFGKYLSIENLGILFEPELKHDFSRMLDSYSQNNVLFVKWVGEMDEDNIYFLTMENGIKINIKNLSHIVI
jgi:hypothetical protein